MFFVRCFIYSVSRMHLRNAIYLLVFLPCAVSSLQSELTLRLLCYETDECVRLKNRDPNHWLNL